MDKPQATGKTPLDGPSLKKILSRLNRHAFAEFTYKLCACSARFECPGWLPEAGEGVFYAGFLDSYGGSLHNVWVLHFLPEEFYTDNRFFSCEDPGLVKRLQSVGTLYKGQTGFWGMAQPFVEKARKLRNVCIVTNIHGYDRDAYARTFMPGYKRVIRQCGMRIPFQLGSYDSFIDLDEEGTRSVLLSFLTQRADGISISIHPEKRSVSEFSFESPLALKSKTKRTTPFESVYVGTSRANALLEFESLLKPGVSEARIERFLKAHYQEIFGFEYDRIETQLWLRFPNLDVTGRNRRLDVFLRNCIQKDWELFELKRIVRMTGSHRDIPVLSTEVTRSIQQTLYYGKLLSSDLVKQSLAKDGIEYFEPSLNLVVGRTPQIPHDHWRWLTSRATNGVVVHTYDNLIEKMRLRTIEREYAVKLLCRG